MRTRLPENRAAWHCLQVFQSAATIAISITIKYFVVLSRARYTQSVSEPGYRGEVAYKNEGIVHVFTTAHERYNTVVSIMYIYPGEPFWITVQSVETWFALVDCV